MNLAISNGWTHVAIPSDCDGDAATKTLYEGSQVQDIKPSKKADWEAAKYIPDERTEA